MRWGQQFMEPRPCHLVALQERPNVMWATDFGHLLALPPSLRMVVDELSSRIFEIVFMSHFILANKMMNTERERVLEFSYLCRLSPRGPLICFASCNLVSPFFALISASSHNLLPETSLLIFGIEHLAVSFLCCRDTHFHVSRYAREKQKSRSCIHPWNGILFP